MSDDLVALPRKVRDFHACPDCDYDLVTGEGTRSCHYYECPYLPELLDVRCPTCLYNFASGEGSPACGDDPDCEFAREVVPERLRALHAWAALQRARA